MTLVFTAIPFIPPPASAWWYQPGEAACATPLVPGIPTIRAPVNAAMIELRIGFSFLAGVPKKIATQSSSCLLRFVVTEPSCGATRDRAHTGNSLVERTLDGNSA